MIGIAELVRDKGIVPRLVHGKLADRATTRRDRHRLDAVLHVLRISILHHSLESGADDVKGGEVTRAGVDDVHAHRLTHAD